MSRIIDIIYIYTGTQGTAGTYLNEIIMALNDINVRVKSYSSYYYPFNNATKIFYRYTDLANGKKKRWYRPYLRYLEMILSLVRILLYCIISPPKIINYSLNTAYWPEYIFLKLIKFLKIKLIITSHDVIPFYNAYVNPSRENSLRTLIYNTSDYILVHNNNSITDLKDYYMIPNHKIVYHRFPIMDLSYIEDIPKIDSEYDFLFIGHLRQEKGVNILLESWLKFNNKYPDATLAIVGNIPKGVHLDTNLYKNANVTFVLDYVSDSEYVKYIKYSRCTILPYMRGTNSGIPSSVISLNRQLIVSDIPMFKNNVLIDKSSFFVSGDSHALYLKLEEYYLSYNNINTNNTIKIYNYRKQFIKEVEIVYRNLL